MNVRKAGRDDIERLITLRMDYLLAEKGALTPEEEVDLRKKLKSYFTRHVDEGFIAVVAENEGEILSVAFMSLVERPPMRAFSSYLVGRSITCSPTRDIGERA